MAERWGGQFLEGVAIGAITAATVFIAHVRGAAALIASGGDAAAHGKAVAEVAASIENNRTLKDILKSIADFGDRQSERFDRRKH